MTCENTQFMRESLDFINEMAEKPDWIQYRVSSSEFRIHRDNRREYWVDADISPMRVVFQIKDDKNGQTLLSFPPLMRSKLQDNANKYKQLTDAIEYGSDYDEDVGDLESARYDDHAQYTGEMMKLIEQIGGYQTESWVDSENLNDFKEERDMFTFTNSSGGFDADYEFFRSLFANLAYTIGKSRKMG